MFGIDVIEKIIEDTTKTVLDAVESTIDDTDFKKIADTAINKVEGLCKEDGIFDKRLEAVMLRLRNRYNIEDSNPDN